MLGMLGDKKKLASSLVENLLSGKKQEEGEPRNDPSMGLSVASEELLEAVLSRDPSLLSKALDSYFEMKFSQIESRKDAPTEEFGGENGDIDIRTA